MVQDTTQQGTSLEAAILKGATLEGASLEAASLEAAILRGADAVEFSTAERCDIAEWSNSAADPALSIARARVPVGGTTGPIAANDATVIVRVMERQDVNADEFRKARESFRALFDRLTRWRRASPLTGGARDLETSAWRFA